MFVILDISHTGAYVILSITYSYRMGSTQIISLTFPGESQQSVSSSVHGNDGICQELMAAIEAGNIEMNILDVLVLEVNNKPEVRIFYCNGRWTSENSYTRREEDLQSFVVEDCRGRG